MGIDHQVRFQNIFRLVPKSDLNKNASYFFVYAKIFNHINSFSEQFYNCMDVLKKGYFEILHYFENYTLRNS